MLGRPDWDNRYTLDRCAGAVSWSTCLTNLGTILANKKLQGHFIWFFRIGNVIELRPFGFGKFIYYRKSQSAFQGMDYCGPYSAAAKIPQSSTRCFPSVSHGFLPWYNSYDPLRLRIRPNFTAPTPWICNFEYTTRGEPLRSRQSTCKYEWGHGIFDNRLASAREIQSLCIPWQPGKCFPPRPCSG